MSKYFLKANVTHYPMTHCPLTHHSHRPTTPTKPTQNPPDVTISQLYEVQHKPKTGSFVICRQKNNPRQRLALVQFLLKTFCPWPPQLPPFLHFCPHFIFPLFLFSFHSFLPFYISPLSTRFYVAPYTSFCTLRITLHFLCTL